MDLQGVHFDKIWSVDIQEACWRRNSLAFIQFIRYLIKKIKLQSKELKTQLELIPDGLTNKGGVDKMDE